MDHNETVAVTERLLAAALGGPVRVVDHSEIEFYEGAPNTILRCEVETAGVKDPTVVVVKRSKDRAGLLFHEWAALEFLAPSGLAPRLFAGDRERELLVLEDLGPAPERLLGNILQGRDAKRAEAALLEFQRALGRLHARTAGHGLAYDAIRRRHRAEAVGRHRIHQIPAVLVEFSRIPAGLGVEPSHGFEAELHLAAAEILEPGEFLVFTHGDATPANAFYDGETVRFLDFETCGFRHALLDGSFAPLRYLHSVWARRLPLSLREAALAAYREELVKGCPLAADDERFQRATAACAAAWLAGLCRLLEGVMEDDQRWGLSTNRQRIVAGLEHAAEVCAGPFDAIARTAERLGKRLRGIWPLEDCDLRSYRAFA